MVVSSAVNIPQLHPHQRQSSEAGSLHSAEGIIIYVYHSNNQMSSKNSNSYETKKKLSAWHDLVTANVCITSHEAFSFKWSLTVY